MTSDNTTFVLAFLAIFGIIIAYIWRLNRLANRLEKTANEKNRNETEEP